MLEPDGWVAAPSVDAFATPANASASPAVRADRIEKRLIKAPPSACLRTVRILLRVEDPSLLRIELGIGERPTLVELGELFELGHRVVAARGRAGGGLCAGTTD